MAGLPLEFRVFSEGRRYYVEARLTEESAALCGRTKQYLHPPQFAGHHTIGGPVYSDTEWRAAISVCCSNGAPMDICEFSNGITMSLSSEDTPRYMIHLPDGTIVPNTLVVTAAPDKIAVVESDLWIETNWEVGDMYMSAVWGVNSIVGRHLTADDAKVFAEVFTTRGRTQPQQQLGDTYELTSGCADISLQKKR